MIATQKLDEIFARFEYLEAKMGTPIEADELVALSREYAELKPVIEQIAAYRTTVEDIASAELMLDDPEMKELAEEELPALRDALPALEHAVMLALLPKDDADARPALLEIRAGTGGDEAALFAGDLFRMYARYAEARGWTLDLVDESATELGGYKEVVAHISGSNVFGRMKFESGVHRVQRVPETESGGRIHTSAATVAVLPEAENVEIDIPATDIRIDTMRSSGAGGQHVNTTDSAVRITHLPTGIIVTSSEKSQHRNREKAMQVLKARLYDLERQKLDDERASERKGQVGSGDRSERIRTYNFPQGRITDHRINLTLYKLDQAMNGEIDEIIDALTAADQAEKTRDAEPMTIGEVFDYAVAELRLAGTASPIVDARWIISDVLGRDAGTLRLFPELAVTDTEFATIQECIRARCKGQPVAQIIGKREFWGRVFRVSSDTLDPRPETEQIVSLAAIGPAPKRILDLGTGTGCLLVTLLAEYRQATGLGTDVSEAALAIAEENAATHGVGNRATFHKSDWWDGFEGKFDLIVSNPPYIPAADIAELDRDVRDWEPHLALTPGGDGLDAYRQIAAGIATRAAPGARVILEVGIGQADAVAEIFSQVKETTLSFHKDLNDVTRNIIVKFDDKTA